MEQLPLWGNTTSTPARKSIPLLSKSRFVAGLQCHKRLYFECYHHDMRDPLDLTTKALFETGSRVGIVARGLFAGGVRIRGDYTNPDDAVRTTAAALEQPAAKAIYEAAFNHGNVRIRVDILAPAGNGSWDLIEVKSSAGYKEDYLPDGPAYPLAHLPRTSPKLLLALRDADIEDSRDIPEDFAGLSDLHRRIR